MHPNHMGPWGRGSGGRVVEINRLPLRPTWISKHDWKAQTGPWRGITLRKRQAARRKKDLRKVRRKAARRR